MGDASMGTRRGIESKTLKMVQSFEGTPGHGRVQPQARESGEAFQARGEGGAVAKRNMRKGPTRCMARRMRSMEPFRFHEEDEAQQGHHHPTDQFEPSTFTGLEPVPSQGCHG